MPPPPRPSRPSAPTALRCPALPAASPPSGPSHTPPARAPVAQSSPRASSLALRLASTLHPRPTTNHGAGPPSPPGEAGAPRSLAAAPGPQPRPITTCPTGTSARAARQSDGPLRSQAVTYGHALHAPAARPAFGPGGLSLLAVSPAGDRRRGAWRTCATVD